MIATILPILLAAAPVSGDQASLDAAVAEVFRPYRQEPADSTPPWERPIWSAQVRALIAHWQRVLPDDEPDRLNDGDWLCQCQDYDARGFKAMTRISRIAPDGTATVEMAIDLGFDEVRDLRTARLTFRREAGAWKLDEMSAPEAFPQGLRQALRETIAEDEALARAKTK